MISNKLSSFIYSYIKTSLSNMGTNLSYISLTNPTNSCLHNYFYLFISIVFNLSLKQIQKELIHVCILANIYHAIFVESNGFNDLISKIWWWINIVVATYLLRQKILFKTFKCIYTPIINLAKRKHKYTCVAD